MSNRANIRRGLSQGATNWTVVPKEVKSSMPIRLTKIKVDNKMQKLTKPTNKDR